MSVIDLLITEPNGNTHLFRCPIRVVVLRRTEPGHKALFEIDGTGRTSEPRTCLDMAESAPLIKKTKGSVAA